ncbi:unnamed protein product, partial [Sphagnum compactum]
NAKLAGRKQQKRVHDIIYADELVNCTPSQDKINYLYVLRTDQIFDRDLELKGECDMNRRVYHELLSNDNCFAILTAKQIPKLPGIRLFMSFGEIQVKIAKDPVEVQLTEQHLSHLRQYHGMLFRNLLGITKSKHYLAYDFEGGSNSYMIVPVTGNNINWKMLTISKVCQNFVKNRKENDFICTLNLKTTYTRL